MHGAEKKVFDEPFFWMGNHLIGRELGIGLVPLYDIGPRLCRLHGIRAFIYMDAPHSDFNPKSE